MFKKIVSLAMSCVLLFQCFMNVSAHGDNIPRDNTEINMLASQIDYEMEEKREENVKYFKLKDEQILKVEYPTAVHMKNENGKWEDLYNKERKNTIRFSENAGSDELVRIEREQYSLSWNLENTLDSPL